MPTAKDRLITILDGEDADRPACICPGGMMNMVTAELQDVVHISLPEAHSDARMMADLAKAVYTQGCFENVGVPFCMTVEAEALGATVTMGTRLFEPHVTGYATESVTEYGRLSPIDLGAGRAKVVLDAIAILKEELDGVPIVGNLVGPVSVASSVTDPVNFYKELAKKRTVAHEYMEFVTQQLISFGLAQIEAGADVITIAEPSGTGEILGPRMFAEYVVTYLNELIDALENAGGRTIVHICGQMHSVYQQMAEVRADALSFDAVVPIKRAKENLPGRTIMGNVSTFAIELGEPEKVASLTQSCVRAGSDIIAPACGLGMGSPLTNVKEVLKTVKASQYEVVHAQEAN